MTHGGRAREALSIQGRIICSPRFATGCCRGDVMDSISSMYTRLGIVELADTGMCHLFPSRPIPATTAIEFYSSSGIVGKIQGPAAARRFLNERTVHGPLELEP